MGCLPVFPADVKSLPTLCFLVCKSIREIVHSLIEANVLNCGGVKMSDVPLGADGSVVGLGTGRSWSKVGRDKVPGEHVQGRDWLCLIEGRAGLRVGLMREVT